MTSHPGIFTHTQARRDEILSRDSAERAGMGGIRQFISSEVTNEGSASQPNWTLTALYSDFSTETWRGPGTSRGIPALA